MVKLSSAGLLAVGLICCLPAGAAPPPLSLEALPALTAARTLQVRGQTAPDSTVTVRLAEQELSATADASGAFEIGPLELAEGQNDLEVTAVLAGETAVVTGRVVADRQPPPVELSPLDPALPGVLRGRTEPGSRVVLIVGHRRLPPVLASAEGTFQFTLPAGEPQPLRVVVADAAGNETGVEPVAGVATNVAATDAPPAAPGADGGPTLRLDPPFDQDGLTAQRQLACLGEVAPGASLRVRLNDRPVLVTSLDGEGRFALLGLPLQPGDNLLVCEATDAAGQRRVVQRRITLDETAPALVLDAPLNQALWRSAAEALVVRGTTEPGLRVVLDRLPGGRQEATAEADGRFQFVTLVPVGGTSLVLSVTDAAGNETVVRRRLEIDRVPPVVQLTRPVERPYVERSTVGLTGQTEPGTAVTLRHDGTTAGAAEAAAGGDFSFSAGPLRSGQNPYELVAADGLGNTRTIPLDLPARLAPPWLQLTEPEEGWQAVPPTRLALVVEADARLQATLDGQPLTGWSLAPPMGGVALVAQADAAVETPPAPPSFDDTAPWRAATLSLPALAPGVHVIVVEARSPSGQRRNTVRRTVIVPGAPRAVELREVAPMAAGVQLTAVATDEAGELVADGTPVTFQAPAGWHLEGREFLTVTTVRGVATALVQPFTPAGPTAPDAIRRTPRRGIVRVTAGRITESARVPVR